jgi:hypothetical protein
MTAKSISGKIVIPSSLLPELHELQTASFLANLGRDVEFLIPIDKDHIKTPDIKMDGILWEIKAPKGNSSRTVENNLRTALMQSKNLILDLRRSKLNEQKAISQVNKEFKLRKNITNLIVITKSRRLLDLKR